MTINIKLSTGKEIELTEAEYAELRLGERVVYPVVYPYAPSPVYQAPGPGFIGPPYIATCKTGAGTVDSQKLGSRLN